MSRRQEIELTREEQERFLATSKIVILSSIDGAGYPHSVPMWFVVDEGTHILMTTYGKSQKVVNLRRNPKVALLVESGTEYQELKGLLLRGRAEVVEEQEEVVAALKKVHHKYYGSLPAGIDEAMKAQARKRVVIKIKLERAASWDHDKLGGRY